MIHSLLPIAYLCAIVFCLYTSCWLILRANRNRITGALAACQIFVIIWCVPQLFLTFPMSREMKYVLYGISYIGISFIGPAWLIFSCFYCGRNMKYLTRGLIFGISAVDYSIFLTNESHHLFYLIFEVEQVVYGPVFYFHMVYTYSCVLFGMLQLLKAFWRKQVATVHMVLLILTAAVPFGFNILYLSGLVQTGFDLTPPAFALSSFFMLLAVFRYDFPDVNVLAFEPILESIAEGVIVYNKRGEIMYCNQASRGWLGLEAGDGFVKLKTALGQAGAKMKQEEMAWESRELALQTGERIRLKQYIHRNKKGIMCAGTILLSDVGEYYKRMQQERDLAVSSQRLAIEQERNRIAQEVHDTAGHTLTMIHSLIQLIRLECEADREPLQDYLNQAQGLTSDGIRNLRLAINHMRQEASWELVTQGVRQLAGSVKGLPVEVEIQGEDGPEYSHLSVILYECLREAITNCLKYAKARRMDVIVKFETEQVSLYIFDDGQGCGQIAESHGLRGIRQRVEQAGGQVRVLSAEGEGFQIYIRLPAGAAETRLSVGFAQSRQEGEIG